jgi:hypothetical protein
MSDKRGEFSVTERMDLGVLDERPEGSAGPLVDALTVFAPARMAGRMRDVLRAAEDRIGERIGAAIPERRQAQVVRMLHQARYALTPAEIELLANVIANLYLTDVDEGWFDVLECCVVELAPDSLRLLRALHEGSPAQSGVALSTLGSALSNVPREGLRALAAALVRLGLAEEVRGPAGEAMWGLGRTTVGYRLLWLVTTPAK